MFIGFDMVSEREMTVVFTYHSLHFSFSWRCPCDYDAICCTDGKTIQWSLNAQQYEQYVCIVLSSTVSQLCKPQVEQMNVVSVPQPTIFYLMEMSLRL